MIYTIGEKSLNFILDGEVYFCSSDDERFETIKQMLISEKGEEEIKVFYYKRFIQDAKAILNGDKNGVS